MQPGPVKAGSAARRIFKWEGVLLRNDICERLPIKQVGRGFDRGLEGGRTADGEGECAAWIPDRRAQPKRSLGRWETDFP